MIINVKKLDKNAKLPFRKYSKDSGADLYFNHPEGDGFSETIEPFESKLLNTGICLQLPKPSYADLTISQLIVKKEIVWELQIRSKSGLASKENLFVLNSPGTVDNNYTGEIKVILYNAGNKTQHIFHHDKIAQAVLCPIVIPNFKEVDELENTDRSEKGFGSTGKK